MQAPATPVGAQGWALIVMVSLSAALVVVDSTVVNPALPTIASDLRMSSGLMQWVHESYILVFAALLLYFGQLGDRIGRRRMLLVGILVLVLASALAAAATTSGVLLTARALQGLGAAMIFPTTLAILSSSFQGRERATAFAVWGGTIGVTAGLGAVLGGWLTTSFSWRVAFAMFVPVGLALAVAARLVITENRASGPARGVDMVATVLTVVAMSLAVLAVTQCPRWGFWAPGAEVAGWPVSPVPLLLAISALIGIVLIKRQRRYPKHRRRLPLDLSPLSIRSFRNGSFIAAAISLGEFGLIFALPFWWQNALGHSAAQTGALVLVPTATALVAATMAAAFIQRFGALRVVRIGLVFEAAAMGGLAATMSTTTAFGTVATFLSLYGVGLGLASAQLGSLVLSGVPEKSAGAASGTMTTAQQLGAALGVAVLGLVMLTTLKADLLNRLADLGMPADRAASLAATVGDSTGGAIAGLAGQPATAAAADAARAALSSGVSAAIAVSAFVLVSALVATRTLATSPAAEMSADLLASPIDGAAPDWAGPNGAGPNGAGPDWTGPNWTPADWAAATRMLPVWTAPTERLRSPRETAPSGRLASPRRMKSVGGGSASGARWHGDPVTRPVAEHPRTAPRTA